MPKFSDLTGVKYGRLTCLKRVDRPVTSKQGTYWETLCECGNIYITAMGNLISGTTISCGCYRKERSLIDLTGKIFGRLTCISRVIPTNKRKDKRYWNCICECGVATIVTTGALRSGKTLSCGCLQRETAKEIFTKHGNHSIKGGTYISWKAMRSRCKNINNPDHKYYSDKGIKVCARWDTYANFLEDMGERPDGSYSIDRKDSDLDYTPENCYWATPKEQSMSIKSSVQWIPVKIEGVLYKNLAEARKVLGITTYRLKKLNELKNEATN